MIGQQLDLFGGPLRPPKKILVDEPAPEEQAASPEVDETAIEPDPITEELTEEPRPVLTLPPTPRSKKYQSMSLLPKQKKLKAYPKKRWQR